MLLICLPEELDCRMDKGNGTQLSGSRSNREVINKEHECYSNVTKVIRRATAFTSFLFRLS